MANAAAGLEVRESGRALRFHTETPHLVSTGSGRLSTTVTLHPLPEGRVILGCSREADIHLGGSGVEFVHCIIENAGGSVTLHPLSGTTCVDGAPLLTPQRLTQGCMLTIGRSNYLRFNHPAEAKQLKSKQHHHHQQQQQPRMANGTEEWLSLGRKPPAGPARGCKSTSRDLGCSDDEINFLGKLSKFEMLSRAQPKAHGHCLSPKVFPPGSLTTSVPADQILTHTRSSSLVSLPPAPLHNLTNIDRCHNDDNHFGAGLKQQQHQAQGQNGTYANVSQCARELQQAARVGRGWREPGDENRNNNAGQQQLQPSNASSDLMSRSLTCQRSCELGQFGRQFDMSQSLILAKTTTTCTEFLQLDQYAPAPSHRRAGSCDNTQTFGSQSNMRRVIQPPSPAFNREPKFSYEVEGGSEAKSVYGRIRSPGEPQSLRHSHEELERQEKLRLEEILATCAEYERQSSRALPDKPSHNRSSTNGSLPREQRRQFAGRAMSPPTYENVATPNNNQTPDWPAEQQQQQQRNGHEEQEPTSSRQAANPTSLANGSSATTSTTMTTTTMTTTTATTTTTSPQVPEKPLRLALHNYENFVPANGNLSMYENVAPLTGSNQHYANGLSNHNINNNNNNNTSNNNNNSNSSPNNMSLPRPKKRDACVTIDNKLDVSNDDLLEAIEQLSMLSKPRNSTASIGSASLCLTSGPPSNPSPGSATGSSCTATTPKRINSERDNAKSNEAKADKERKELEEEDRKKYVEFLQNEKQHILGNMDGFKRSVADIETQEEEIHRELELEAALLSAEHESESLKLEQDEAEASRMGARLAELEDELAESNAVQAQLQTEARQRVAAAQQHCASLEQQLADARGRDDLRDSELADRLAASADKLDTERKAFEDLEFHHLEQEASTLAAREELQRHIGELNTKIESRKMQLNQLDTQRTDIKNAVSKEAKSLERQKLAHLRRLEEGRNRLRAIDDELESLAKNVADNPDDKRSPSREDFDRISRVTTDSPIVNNQGSLGRKTIESLKEIERNRQLHLAKQGSQVISEERRRVEELKRRVQDEVRSQWEERKMNCTSFNSVESGEESSSYSTGPTESGSGSSDGADNGTGEKLSPSKLSEFNSPSPGPSGNSYTLLPTDNPRDERPTSMETERFNGNGNGIVDDSGSRPLSQTSSELESLSPLQVKHRDKPKLQRPLTRYLPIKSESLDLRHHIETAGHQLFLINDVTVDTTSCSGYLSKMSKKFHHWNKRWFVFDRKRKTLSYYSDNNSRKPRGVIYFQSIEEVYVDHLNSVKSPQPSLTFIVKTTTRLYHLMAPSPEAMRVWVDVVFTGAEGYHEFDPNS